MDALKHLPFTTISSCHQASLQQERSPCKQSPLAPSSHTCRLCYKAFASFRALNGHMRIHGGSSDLASRDLRRPDTHKLPAMEEEVAEDKEEEEYVETEAAEHEEEEEDYEATDESSLDINHDGRPDVGSAIMYKFEPLAMQPELLRNTLLARNKELRINWLQNKRKPLYELRQNPKRSKFITDVDFWGLQECPAKEVSSPLSSEIRTYPCSMCSRVFLSPKALHGHMRAHPDRPSSRVLLPNSTLLERPVHSGSGKGHCAYSLVDRDTEIHDKKPLCNEGGAGHPVMGTSRTHNTNIDPQKAELGAQNTIGAPTRQGRSTPEAALTSTSLSIEKEPVQLREKDTETDQESLEGFAAICLVMLSAGKTDLGPAKGRLDDLDHVSGYTEQECEMQEAKFKGKAWNRFLKSPQSLGGHRANHANLKSSIKKEKAYAYKVESNELPREVKVHTCSICHRTFPTGQALGGHKRCHFTREKNADYEDAIASINEKPLRLLNEANETATSKERRFVIDLNLPARLDDVDEHGLYSCSPPSSLESHAANSVDAQIANDSLHRSNGTRDALIVDENVHNTDESRAES